MSQFYCHDVDGYLVVDKPEGMSSNALLQRVRRLLGAKKAGHGGTLDPMASGVMLLAFGRATKVLSFMLADQKKYRVGFQLGVETTTGDATGEIVGQSPSAITAAEIQTILTSFLGPIHQVPPMYSALKHKGVPLYALARKGEVIERQSREVTIHTLTLLGFDEKSQQGELEVSCSKGTYMRTLVEDIGKKLGVGAHVNALRRLASGSIGLEQALSLEDLQMLAEEKGREYLTTLLSSCDTLVGHHPVYVATQNEIMALRHGLKSSPVFSAHASSWFRLIDPKGMCVALAWSNAEKRFDQLRWFCEVLPERLLKND